MGRKIDRICIVLLATCALWILFYRLSERIFLSVGMTFAAMMLLKWCFARRESKRPMSVAQAESILWDIASMPDEDARRILARLSGFEEDDALITLPRLPKSKLSADELFALWRKHRGEAVIHICVTCNADRLPYDLSLPTIEICDAKKLIPAIRRSDMVPLKRKKVRAPLADRIEKFSWKKGMLYGLFMLPSYLLTGNILYLVVAIGTLFLSGITLRLRKKQRP